MATADMKAAAAFLAAAFVLRSVKYVSVLFIARFKYIGQNYTL